MFSNTFGTAELVGCSPRPCKHSLHKSSSDHLPISFHTLCIGLDTVRETSLLQGLILNIGAAFGRVPQVTTAHICNCEWKRDDKEKDLTSTSSDVLLAGHSYEAAEKTF